MWQIQTKWTNVVVFQTTERLIAIDWLEVNNNDPEVFKLVKVKVKQC